MGQRTTLPALRPIIGGTPAPGFPIVEAFGFPYDATTQQAQDARSAAWCPFAGTACEKFRQYGYGYCSVWYAAAGDRGTARIYAVCDHRLDGLPINHAVYDHFAVGDKPQIVPEVTMTKPRMSFDYVAIKTQAVEIKDVIVIETQAIDIRGGGVGPAWQAWRDGTPERWREYFTAEAKRKGRKDSVAYGVNMGNIYKRLGLQILDKGSFLKRLGIPVYVVMQDSPFRYLRARIPFQEVGQGGPYDLTFMTFDYTGAVNADGSLQLGPAQVVRTTLGLYMAALSAGSRPPGEDLQNFLLQVQRKAGLSE